MPVEYFSNYVRVYINIAHSTVKQGYWHLQTTIVCYLARDHMTDIINSFNIDYYLVRGLLD